GSRLWRMFSPMARMTSRPVARSFVKRRPSREKGRPRADTDCCRVYPYEIRARGVAETPILLFPRFQRSACRRPPHLPGPPLPEGEEGEPTKACLSPPLPVRRRGLLG